MLFRSINGVLSSDYVVYQEEDTLYFHQKKKMFSIINTSWGEVVIKVPTGYNVDLDIDTISGDVKVKTPCNDIDINATSGKVDVYQGGNELDIKVVSGSINVYKPFTEISVKSVSGGIKVTGDKTTQEIEAKTTSGSIRIQMEQDAGYTMEYQTVSGKVSDDYSGMSGGKSGKFSHGDKSTQINAKVVSGNIYLSNWQ